MVTTLKIAIIIINDYKLYIKFIYILDVPDMGKQVC
jgi:hypothetical protein